MTQMFGDNASIYFKNIYMITMPNFFKNLVFSGGPQVKRGYFQIRNGEDLDLCISDFNAAFEKFAISVSREDIREECMEKLNWLESEAMRCSWLKHW